MIQRQTKEIQTAVEKKRLEMDTKFDTKVEHLAILLGRREVYRKAIQQLQTHKRQLETFRKTVKVICMHRELALTPHVHREGSWR